MTIARACLRVAITGGSGKIGQAAIDALLEAGHDVVNFDLALWPMPPRTVVVDCANFGQVMGALSGTDLIGGRFNAVVHLAAIPPPGLMPDHRIFESNVLSTYNVFSACRRLGIDRVVWASSETLMGQPYPSPPGSVPLDETVSLPGWSYSLTKHLGEEMAKTFVRWAPGLAITSLRFSHVYAEQDYAALPAIQQRPELRRNNLWAYVDARDCGRACLLALDAALPGHDALIIAAADTVIDVPSRTLMARYFPEVTISGAMRGCETLISIDKARRLIGYEPRHSWRDRRA